MGKKPSNKSREELMALTVSEIVQQLIKAHKYVFSFNNSKHFYALFLTLHGCVKNVKIFIIG